MSEFLFEKKPKNWKEMPLFKKIKYSMKKLNKHFSPYVHKLEAKKIVKEICGDEIEVPKTIRILKNPDDIDKSDLNTKHIIKGAHGCDFNINIKSNINIIDVREKLHSFNKPYHRDSEKQYSFLKPQFFIEEKIEDKIYGKTGNAICYMLRCIHGVPVSFTILLKHINRSRSFFFNKDKSLTAFDQLECCPFYNIDISKIGKKNIEKMYDLACKLSKKFEFVRIDLYLGKNNKIYFSEFTFSPASGQQRFPMEVEKSLGKLWK